MTSARSGTLRRVVAPSPRRAAAMRGRVAFLLPETRTSPSSRAPPSMWIWSKGSVLLGACPPGRGGVSRGPADRVGRGRVRCGRSHIRPPRARTGPPAPAGRRSPAPGARPARASAGRRRRCAGRRPARRPRRRARAAGSRRTSAGERGDLAAGDVGRIGDHDVEGRLALHRGEEVAHPDLDPVGRRRAPRRWPGPPRPPPARPRWPRPGPRGRSSGEGDRRRTRCRCRGRGAGARASLGSAWSTASTRSSVSGRGMSTRGSTAKGRP